MFNSAVISNTGKSNIKNSVLPELRTQGGRITLNNIFLFYCSIPVSHCPGK